MSTLDAPPRAYPTRGGAALAPAPVPSRRPAPRPAPEVTPRHLRVVAPTERVRRRLTPKMGVLLTGVLFAMLFLIAISHTVLVQGQIRLDDLDAQLTAEQARYQDLRTTVAELESPARVVAAAEDLGMVTPSDLVYLQPSEPDAAIVPAAPGARDGGTEVAGSTATWADVKPLLEMAAP